MSRTFAIGLSGQLGDALRPLLSARGESVLALSRQPRAAAPGIEWQLGDLETLPDLPPDLDCILSLGPLDCFAIWVEHRRPKVARIVAIGSTGRTDKQDSLDAVEREEAARFAAGEATLFAYGREQGIAVTVLRPTMLYGSRRDSLTRLVAIARRWRLLPLPASATGLRQPVHVADVARAVLDCRDAEASHGRGFDLPGAERLSFEAMVRRALARQAPSARVLRLPAWLFRAAFGLAAIAGRGGGVGWLRRLARDQVADATDARLAFGYSPRAFEP